MVKYLPPPLTDPSLSNGDAQQALAADGAIACFSSNFFPLRLKADRAPQLKTSVRRLRVNNRCQ
jgi:hypothetical protein